MPSGYDLLRAIRQSSGRDFTQRESESLYPEGFGISIFSFLGLECSGLRRALAGFGGARPPFLSSHGCHSGLSPRRPNLEKCFDSKDLAMYLLLA